MPVMSSAVQAPSSGPSLTPADLDRTQRGVLVGVVVLAHVLLAWTVITTVHPSVAEEATPAIEVSLITQEAAVEARPPEATPKPPEPVPVKQPVAAPRVPVQNTPKMVASTAPPQPTEMQAPAAPPETPPAPAPAVAQQTAAPPPSPAPAAVSTAPVSKPASPKEMPSASVRYLVQPPQVYPRVSRELGETGVVKLRLLIDEQGRLKSIDVVQSSGYPRLDQQALSNMRQARFQPYVDNGVPREVATTASIVFSLEEQ
jgi:protein TonB